MPGGLLAEQQRHEGTIARIRWGAVALALLLGPLFPSLSPAAVVGLALGVAAYNGAVQWSSSRSLSLDEHRRVAELRIDFAQRKVSVGERVVQLTPTEYNVLYHLATNAGRLMPHETLLAKVWGHDYRDEVHYLKVYVGRLRNKIETDPQRPRYILTVRGVGYQFPAAESPVAEPR